MNNRVAICAVGGTIVGPRHSRDGALNQDAWARYRFPHAVGVVVSDGVGSCVHARIGSRAACLAVRDAVRSMDEQTTLVQLVERVSVAWRSRLLGHAPSDCAATCLFAMRNRAGRLWIGGIGDGLAAVVMGNGTGPLHVVPLRGGEFGETVALGDGRESLGWVVQEFDDHSASMRALLASDGIANDLAVDQIGSFTNWVVDSFGRLPSRRWREQIRRQLTAWPTLGSIDDRALAVLWPRLESRTCQI